MKTTVINKWWIPVLVGIILIVGATYIMMQPVAAFVGLALLFGWLILLSGVLNIIFSIQNKKFFDDWIWYLLLGIFETILGVALLLQPGLSAESLILFTAFWLVFTAVNRVTNAFVLKRIDIPMWWLPLLSGVLIFIFSFLLLINPIFAVISIVYLTAIPILISGIMMVYFGIELKKLINL
jgi:uncharacterized membrane protein HdeD (DUF308 family)